MADELTKPASDLTNQPDDSPLGINHYDIDAFLQMRKEFITKVNRIMVDGKDYHVIQGKKTLAKGGAEKIANIFGWQASFTQDEDVLEAFKIEGLIAFKCSLTKASAFVGEGRGGASLAKNAGDPNKTIKMAQKSAFIDAVLRASGLSDFFTQDLEDMNPKDFQKPSYTQNSAPRQVSKTEDEYAGAPASVKPISQPQAWKIKSLRTQKGLPQLSDPELRKLTSLEASNEIKRLIDLDESTIEREIPE